MSKLTFDVSNKQHLEEFAYFLEFNKWKTTCPFILEWPWNSVPDMLKDKIVKDVLGVGKKLEVL